MIAYWGLVLVTMRALRAIVGRSASWDVEGRAVQCGVVLWWAWGCTLMAVPGNCAESQNTESHGKHADHDGMQRETDRGRV